MEKALDHERLKARLAGCIDENDIPKFEEVHEEFLKRKEKTCSAPHGGEWGDPTRIHSYALALRQIMLHRAIGTFEGAASALLEDNVYSMVLSIRGHFETTASLGYLYARLSALANGNVARHVVDNDIGTMLLGRRDGVQPEAPEAKQVLSLLEQADRVVSVRILGGALKQHDILSDCYRFLCEFCHPNFHSNSVAFDLDKDRGEFIMRHSREMRANEAGLLGYLLLCSPIFVHLYDELPTIIRSEAI